tara:strand:- start:780 stop:1016 length:237 start_codon:yes stop_codon:yes gene_type:complete
MPGWPELLLIAVIALIVIGPKDLPKLMYKLGHGVRRLQYIRYAFSHQFDQFMKEQEFKDMQDEARERPVLNDENTQQK